jgi:cellulose synthase/poly-beta-1,6-N-acetylglucosamine synthase-like glycosyltransferase
MVLLFCSSIIIFTYAFRSLFFIFTTRIFQENSIIKNKQKEAEENKSIYSKENVIDTLYSDFFPFISILIASYNENIVIERLLSSLSKLSYNYDKFETIIIDDSDNESVDILKKWQKTLPNLKVFHRQNRAGWKGGALNLGLNNLNKNSKIVLVVDADNVLEEDILEKIAKYFREIKEKEYSTYVVQGYPKSLNMSNKKTSFSITQSNKNGSNIDNIIYNKNNWVSRGISLRLYQRNTIEFAAKEKLMLPLQITGSLFAVSTNILKSIRFSEDICEDWDLTLDIYLSKVRSNPLISVENNSNNFNKIRKINYYKINSNNSNSKTNNNINKKERIQKIILFKPELVSYTEITNNIIPYFRQRIRVSEGHTRGFRKKIIKILENERLPLLSKIELFFIGFRYAKYIPLVFLVISDFFLLLIYQSIDNILTNDILKMSIGIQCISLIIYSIHNFFSLKINDKIIRKEFTFKDVFYLLLLNICTMPAFVIGSFLGFIRSKGNFYRTKRNE